MSQLRRGRLLVVDDEKGMCHILNRILTDDGYSVETCLSGKEALERFAEETFDVAMVDLRMSGMDGMELLDHVHRESPDTAVIMMTAFGTVESAVTAMKRGAYEYITKPFNNDEVLHIVNNAMERKRLIDRNRYLAQAVEERNQLSGIIGKSKPMQDLFRLIEKVAAIESTVLILGESGTGKEMVARALHQHSPRKDETFLAVNCGALPGELIESELFGHEKGSFSGAHKRKIGLMESAGRGTILLDEIGDLPLMLQVKLLRVIEQKEVRRVGSVTPLSVDVRVIAATNRDLKEDVEKGEFREDLYFRLSILELTIPPLRERREDIPLLVDHFIQTFNQKMNRAITGVSEDVMRLMMLYHWPGNVRELENAIQRSMVMREQGAIGVEDLPRTLTASTSTADPLFFHPTEVSFLKAREMFEHRYLEKLLELNEGNVTKSAVLAGISRRHMQELMKKYGLRSSSENE